MEATAKKVVNIDIVQLIAERNAGAKLQDLADKYGVVPSTIYTKLHKATNAERLEASKICEGDGDATPVNATEAKALATNAGVKRIPGQASIPNTVAEAIEHWNNFIGYDGKVPKIPVDRPVKLSGDRKILLLNDIHAPYHNEEAIKQAILEQAHDTDVLLIGGDLLDLFTVSRYEKFEQHFSTTEEFRSGKALLNYFASIFPKIRIIPGNHDERWKKYLMTKRNLSPADIMAMNYLVRTAVGDEAFDITDPIYCLTRDLKNVEVVKPVRKDFAQFSFFMQEGDLIVSHAEKFSRTTGQAAAVACQWFVSNAKPMGLVKDFRVFAQCHTHQAGLNWGNFGVWNMECGCLCKVPDYAGGPKLMGAQRPSILGYSVFYQDQTGRTDMRRSRFIPIEG